MYIRMVQIKNYRSLANVNVGSLAPVVTLYGHNDTGKSNLLSFLKHVFQRKLVRGITTVEGKEVTSEQLGEFWRGEITDFNDSFYLNTSDPILFKIIIRFYRRELRANESIPDSFYEDLGNRRYDHLTIEGRIEKRPAGRGEFILDKADFDKKPFYEGGNTPQYLPGFSLSTGEARDVFDAIMRSLDDGFLVVPSVRYFEREDELSSDSQADLTPRKYKNWLLQTNLHRSRESIYRQIVSQFADPPFSYGRVSLARTPDNQIDILIEDKNGLKLPIARKGTGVQQTLIILAYVAQSSSPMIGIEEVEMNLSPQAQRDFFTSLHSLVYQEGTNIDQIIFTTHSPHIAWRNEAERRAVWIENGKTKIGRPSEAHIEGFFRVH